MCLHKMLQTEVSKSSSIQNRQNRKKISNPDISSAIPGVPIPMWELHRNRSFHLLCPLSGRAAVASVAGNPICKFKKDSSVSLGGVALNPHPTWQQLPQDPLSAGAFVSLSEGHVSQGNCYTWELFSQLGVTVHEPCCGGSRDSLGKGFCYVFTLDPGAQAVMLQPCHLPPCAPGMQLSPEHLGMW